MVVSFFVSIPTYEKKISQLLYYKSMKIQKLKLLELCARSVKF